MRYSKQREAILDIVMTSCNHPAARMIYDIVRKQIPNVSLGTVYRNLNTLVDMGLIIRIPMKDGNDRFDKTIIKHNHICCEICNKVIDINTNISSSEFHKIENETGFKITDCNFNIKGICNNCIKERNK